MNATITCAGCNHGYAETALFCPNCGRPKVREAAGDALIGKVLGERFQIQEILGQGGSGTIYRAEHVTLRRRVAIKVLHTELSRDDLAVERFRREATTVAEIDNEHIVEIHDFGRTPDGRLYLAMELLEGETLDHVLAREKQLSVERVADVLIQVGEALMEAHAIGYVHRDLRPRNVYLAVRRGKANFVKLLDFGLAKLVETEGQAASTSLGMTFGDPRYMSPEQARGDRIDRRADIYQLGCVAYEMLTGAPPFSGNRVFDILTKQVTEIPVPLPTRRPGVPLWMESAVTKMLAKDPENRFATTTRMVEALRRGLEAGEVMEDDVARRRESIPPPSVSRVMQRMGITDPRDSPLPQATLPGLPGVPGVPAVAAPASSEPVVTAPAQAAPVVAAPEPAPVVEPPRRRSTGTPKVGVPAVTVPAPDPTQAAVAGTIDPPPPPSPPVEAKGRARRPSSQSGPDSAGISQVWYDEGDRGSDEVEGSRPERARKVISPSTADMPLYDDEPPRRRPWGAILGVAGLLVVGGLAFAMTRGGSASTPTAPEPVASPGPSIDAAPSTIIEAPADAASIATAVPADAAAVVAVAPSGKDRTPHTTKDVSPVDRRPSDVGSLVPSDPNFRRPGGSNTVVTNPTPIVTPKDPGKASGTPGVSGTDGPLDPYGGGNDTPPADSAAPERKAEFFANLGTQQLISGDTAGAAANFKKASELDAKNVSAVIGMGEIALRQGLFGDAIAHLKKASRLSKSARVFTLLGEAYLNSGNSGEAATNFKKALQLDPDNARARDGYNEASSRVPPPDDE
jgi:serine/threonine protein kinase